MWLFNKRNWVSIEVAWFAMSCSPVGGCRSHGPEHHSRHLTAVRTSHLRKKSLVRGTIETS
jgi:hypothetical protein